VVVCNAVYLAMFYHVTGLMKIQVKVEEVLMLLELFMEVEAILMRMRLVFISVVRCMGEHINSNIQSTFLQVYRRRCCVCFKT
jgi:hypothetical protein